MSLLHVLKSGHGSSLVNSSLNSQSTSLWRLQKHMPFPCLHCGTLETVIALETASHCSKALFSSVIYYLCNLGRLYAIEFQYTHLL